MDRSICFEWTGPFVLNGQVSWFSIDRERRSPRKKSLSKAFSLRIFNALSSDFSPQNTQRGEVANKAQKQWDTEPTDLHGSTKMSIGVNPNNHYHPPSAKTFSQKQDFAGL
jgi:hypothetical protein